MAGTACGKDRQCIAGMTSSYQPEKVWSTANIVLNTYSSQRIMNSIRSRLSIYAVDTFALNLPQIGFGV